MGKELIFQTLRHEKTERAPWVPFAGVHAGKLKGYTAEEVLRDGDKLYESLIEVNKLYTPDGMPIVFDLQLEAEILGCELLWAQDNPPSVMSHPLMGSEKKIPCKCTIPSKESGRIPMILDVMRRVKAEIGDQTALYGLICGPFTLASHLRGSEIFMDMIMDEQYVRDLMDFCTEVACAMTDYYVEAGMDVIAVVDPLVSQVSPDHFTAMLSDGFTATYDYIRSKGVFSSFFVCGNATVQMDVMCKTNPDSVSIDENVCIQDVKNVTDKYNIALGGNIPLTTTMLFGNQQDNMKYVVDMIDSMDHHNLIVAPGCDMPYDVPIENTIAVAQAVLETDETREMVKNYEAASSMDIDIELPDYENLDKPLVEAFLLDPLACAACTYMKDAARIQKDEFGDKIDVNYYQYNIKEDIARTMKMEVKQLPSIYVNGELKWSSIIPSKKEFSEVIEKLL
ncbi:methylamine-specific methylcobalamin:coenzyme M methyltransferase [Dethiosulfatibacter aminovorans DSM 17477]|uniref:Methylamine-specific methylcobalamin:coenzyme M methyltransferase n=1 Tax=Dethiosulfatibacter aminovorans DSM 17477 TaxID=1121476 RepID=A0A1M6J7J5_9FIRM|nr:uroporphyrinogen decarboxylase family protein [Dethiosulfatibacter aminovorans]SHJ42652.1 methylamine-specific methylcobalamin:coenzyme M methyltransferase [Dethiosulfatibacter aminovorans DSM 17477]